MSYTNGGQTIDKSMNGIISYDTGGGVVIEGGTVTAENVLATDITCDNLQVNTSATFSGTSTFNTALPTSSITTTTSTNQIAPIIVLNGLYGRLASGVTNAWLSNNTFNSALPTSTITSTTNGNQFITKNIGDALYSGGSLLASNNVWTGTNAFNTSVPTSTLTGTPTATQIAPLQMLSTVLAPKASPTFTGTVTLPNTTCNYVDASNNSTLTFGGFSNNYIRNTGLDGATATNCNVEFGLWQGLGFRDLAVSNTTKIFFNARTGAINCVDLLATTAIYVNNININAIYGRLTSGVTNAWLSTNTFDAILPTSSLTGTPTATQIAPVAMLNNLYLPAVAGGYARLTSVANSFTNTNTFNGNTTFQGATSNTIMYGAGAYMSTTNNVAESTVVTATDVPAFRVRILSSDTKTIKFIPNASVGALNPAVLVNDGVISADSVLTLTADGATTTGIRILDTGVVNVVGTTTNLNATNLAVSGSTTTTFVNLPYTTTTFTTATATQFITKSIGDASYLPTVTGGYARLSTVDNTFTNSNTFGVEAGTTNTIMYGDGAYMSTPNNVAESTSNVALATPAFRIRGFRAETKTIKFIPNATAGALNPATVLNDSVISADSVLTLTADHATNSVGIRILDTGVINVVGTTTNLNATNLAVSASTATSFVNLPATTTTFTTATANQFITKSIGDALYTASGGYARLTASNTFSGAGITNTFQGSSVTLNATYNIAQSAVATPTADPALWIRNNSSNTRTIKFIPNASVGALNPSVLANDSVISANASLNLTTDSATAGGIRMVNDGNMFIRGTTVTFPATNTYTIIYGTGTFLSATDNVAEATTNGALATPAFRIRGRSADTKIIKFIPNATVGALNPAVLVNDGVMSGTGALTLTVDGSTAVGVRIVNTGSAVQIVGTSVTINPPITVGYTTAPTFTTAQIGYTFESAQITWNGATANQVYQSSIITIPVLGVWRIDAYLRVYSGATCRYTFSIAPYNLLPTHAINRVTYDVARLEASPSSIYMMTTYTKFHATGTMLCGTVSATDTNLVPPSVPYTYGMYYVLTRVG